MRGEIDQPTGAPIEHMLGGQKSALLLVHHHATKIGMRVRCIDQDGRQPATTSSTQGVQRPVHRGQDDTGDPSLLEATDIGLLLGVIQIGVGDPQVEPGRRGGRLRPPGDVDEQRVAEIDHHHPHGVAAAGHERPCGVVADETQLVDGLLDSHPGRLGHLVRVVQDV